MNNTDWGALVTIMELLGKRLDQQQMMIHNLRERVKQLESFPPIRDWRGYCEEQARDKGEK